MKNKIFVLNWKMYLTYQESLDFAAQYYDEFLDLARVLSLRNSRFIISPSTIVLGQLGNIFRTTDVLLAAQDCSDHHKGAVTGQISAESLKQVGCQYCIVGHSERRLYAGEPLETIAGKCAQLLKEHISPIICVGESQEDFDAGRTLDVLAHQLEPVLVSLAAQPYANKNVSVCIAYEPIWAIGAGRVPSEDHLELVYAWLASYIGKLAINVDWKLLYGGSVTSKTIGAIVKNHHIDGFLIGGASLDFQELKKIVDCTIAK